MKLTLMTTDLHKERTVERENMNIHTHTLNKRSSYGPASVFFRHAIYTS